MSELNEGLESKISALIDEFKGKIDYWWENSKLWFSIGKEAEDVKQMLADNGYNVEVVTQRGSNSGVAYIRFSPVSQKQVKSQIKDSILGDLLDQSRLPVFEGWMKHPDGVYSADMAEIAHHGSHPRCPKCRQPVNVTNDLTAQIDADNDVTSWKGTHNCGQKLEVFND